MPSNLSYLDIRAGSPASHSFESIQEEGEACLVPSPKQSGGATRGRAGWYPYYAGYSVAFVRSVIAQCKPRAGAIILDPWNGAGTTTQVATELGYGYIGFDLNPAMVLVAKARSLDQSEFPKLQDALKPLLRVAKSFRRQTYHQNDPLGLWFDNKSITNIRHLESAIRCVFNVDIDRRAYLSESNDSTVAFAYMVLFKVLRNNLSKFRVTNPSWLKTAKDTHDLISISFNNLLFCFCEHFTELLGQIDYDAATYHDAIGPQRLASKIQVADSRELPLMSHAADMVISSPPYCTRLDYAVATSLELSVLGFDQRTSLRVLRDRMIGTSTIQKAVLEANDQWGRTCLELLTNIKHHRSKCSVSYYLKTHHQYFDAVFQSMSELDRCLRPSSDCVLVLQTSYYKEIHNDLPKIISEMAESLGWNLHNRSDFRVSRTMSGRNGRSRQYRPKDVATESVLWFRTPPNEDD